MAEATLSVIYANITEQLADRITLSVQVHSADRVTKLLPTSVCPKQSNLNYLLIWNEADVIWVQHILGAGVLSTPNKNTTPFSKHKADTRHFYGASAPDNLSRDNTHFSVHNFLRRTCHISCLKNS